MADFNLSPFGGNEGVAIPSSAFNNAENGNKYIIAAPKSFKGLTGEKIITTKSFNNYLTWGAVKNIVRVYTAFEYNIDKDKLEGLYKGNGTSTEDNYLQSFAANTEYIVSNQNWNKYTYKNTSDKKVDKNDFIKINFDKNLGRNQDIILQIGDMTYSYTGYPYISETDWKGDYKEDSFNVLYYDNSGNNYRVKLPDGMNIPQGTNINVWTRKSADPIGNENKATISLGTSSVILDSKVAENKHVVVDKSEQFVGILVAKEETLPKVDEVFTDTKNLTGHTKNIQTDLFAKYDNQTESNADDYTASVTSSSNTEKVSIDGKPYLDSNKIQFNGYKFSLPINEFKNNNSESISKIKKDMKISIRSVKPNLVPSDFVNEQVQAKVYFDWNFVDVGDSIPEVVEKIAPLNEKYLGEEEYKANGFEGENRRLVDGVLASHNGEALEVTALAKRQYPTKETEEAKKTKIPVRSNGKVFLGWSTKPDTTQEEFNNLDPIKNETEFNDTSKAYKFDEKTPIYNSKKLYAVWGDRQIVLNANLKKDETDPVEIIPYTVDIDSDTTIVDLPRMYGKEGFNPKEKTLLGWSTDPNASVPDIENTNTGKYYSDGSKYKVNKVDGKYSTKPIKLYAVWKDYFTVAVTDKNWGEADKRDIKLGLMSRTAVGAPGSEVINDPLAAHIPYYTKPEDIKDYPAGGGKVEWKVPGYDINGARLSYVVVELNNQTLPIFENSKDWASLGVTLTETIVNPDGTVIPGYKRQIVSFPNPNDSDKIDAFSGATTRTALFEGDTEGYYDQIGYNIKIENKKIVVPPPVINQSYEKETFFDFKLPDSDEVNKITFTITRGSEVENITLTKNASGTWISDKGTLINKDETLLRIEGLDPFIENDTVEGVSHTKDADSDSVTMKVKAKIARAKPKDEKQAYKEGNNLVITAKEGVEVLGNDSGAKAPEGTNFELLVNRGTDESPNWEEVQGASLTQNDEGLLKFSIPEGNLNHGDKVVIRQTEPRKSPVNSGTVIVDKEGPYIKLYDEINKTYTTQIKVYEGIKLPAYTLKTFLDDQAKNEDLARLVLNETSSGLKIEDPEAENIRWPIYGDNTLDYKGGEFIVTATDKFGNSRQTSFKEVLSKPVIGNVDPNSQIPDGFVRITFDALSGHYDDNSKKVVYDVIKGLTWDQAENSEPKVLVPQPKYENSTKVFAGTWSLGTENGIKLPPEDLQESILENITYSAEYKVRETDNVIKAANPNDASEQPSGFVKVSLHAVENSIFEHENSETLVNYYVNPEADMTYRQLKAPSVKTLNGYEVDKINPWYSIIGNETKAIGEAQLDDLIKTDIDIYVNLVKTVIENPSGDTPQEGYVRINFEPGNGGSFNQEEVVKFDILKGTSLARAKEAGFKIPTPETNKIHNGWEAKDTVFLKDLSDYTINFNEDLTFTAQYITNSNETVIPYEPADPKNPTDKNDGNIPTVDKDGNTVDKEQYVRVAFNVAPEGSGTLTLGNIVEKEVISALVKKDTLWSYVTLPTKIPTGEYKFWFWTDASVEKVADGDIRTANFIKSGDEVNPEDKDKNLPDGMFEVSIEKGTGIEGNDLFGKTYAVKGGESLEAGKFPQLQVSTDYKDAKWNDGEKDVEDPSQEVINKDTTFTASAVSTLFDKDNVTGLEITTPPTKKDYKVGENFDPTGMVITLTDKNGNTQEVTPDKLGEYGITLEPKDNLQLGIDKITVKKGDLSDTTPITVEDAPDTVSPNAPTVKDPLTGDTTVEVTLPEQDPSNPEKDVKVGDKVVVVVDGGDPIEHVITQEDISTGKVDVTVPSLEKGDKVTTIIKDKDGNESAPIVDTVNDAPIDNQSTKPNVDTIEVGDTEITGTGTPGATITVTKPDGSTKDVTVNPDGTWSVAIDNVEAGDSYNVTQTEKGKKPSGEVTVRIEDNDNNSNVIWTGTVLGLGSGNFETEEVEKDFKIDIAYIHGYPNGEVRPDGNITRAEAAAMFARILKLDQSNSSNPNFADTDNVNAWYNASINAVVAKGLMKGYPDGNFKPNAPITRAEFAQLIKTIDKANSGNAPFEDVKGHWAKEAIDQAYANDRIAGYPDGSFRPDKSITRAEAAKIINSLFDRMVRAKGLLSIESGTIKPYTDMDVSHWGYYEIVEASNTHMFERIYKGAIEEEWSRVIDSYI